METMRTPTRCTVRPSDALGCRFESYDSKTITMRSIGSISRLGQKITIFEELLLAFNAAGVSYLVVGCSFSHLKKRKFLYAKAPEGA
jgi:hypothetical protein